MFSNSGIVAEAILIICIKPEAVFMLFVDAGEEYTDSSKPGLRLDVRVVDNVMGDDVVEELGGFFRQNVVVELEILVLEHKPLCLALWVVTPSSRGLFVHDRL